MAIGTSTRVGKYMNDAEDHRREVAQQRVLPGQRLDPLRSDDHPDDADEEHAHTSSGKICLTKRHDSHSQSGPRPRQLLAAPGASIASRAHPEDLPVNFRSSAPAWAASGRGGQQQREADSPSEPTSSG